MKYIIETKRLRLRELNDNDFDNLKAILSDSFTMKYYPKPYDDNGVLKWLEWSFRCYKKRGFGLWAVELKDGTFIGDCGITLQNIDGEEVFEIGYHFNKKYWNNGYAIEAARACKDWFFKNTEYDEVYSYMNKNNTRSSNVAIKNGMSFVKDYKDNDNVLSVYKITKNKYLYNINMKKYWPKIKDVIEVVGLAFIITFILRMFVLMSVQVKQTSMFPTLHNNDRGISFICTKNIGINRFDIAIVDTNDKLLVKRVIGLPGETIEYKNNILYVNGEEMKEDFLEENVHTSDFSVKLDDDEYYCLGDNRENSSDSRSYGPFNKSAIKSTHIFVLYPFDHFGYKG